MHKAGRALKLLNWLSSLGMLGQVKIALDANGKLQGFSAHTTALKTQLPRMEFQCFHASHAPRVLSEKGRNFFCQIA